MCQPKRRISRALYAVGRQTPQLYECKVSRYEARRFPPAFGKDELNLGISQSLSTGGLSRTPRRCDHNEGHEQHAPARPSCVARPEAAFQLPSTATVLHPTQRSSFCRACARSSWVRCSEAATRQRAAAPSSRPQLSRPSSKPALQRPPFLFRSPSPSAARRTAPLLRRGAPSPAPQDRYSARLAL